MRNSIDLARLAEELGFHRYWLAEHHGGELVAGPSPEVLIGPIAAATKEIRVGSGGVMLPHYSPLKVAENFGVLAGLYPGRIDLGIGRAAGTDPMTTHALQRDRSRALPDDFPDQLAELLGYFERSFPSGHPLARLAEALPGNPETPEPWLLGSSEQSALSGPANSGCATPSPTSSTLAAPPTPSSTARASPPANASSSRGSRSRCGRSSPPPTRRPSASRPAGGWPSTCSAAAARSPSRPPSAPNATSSCTRRSADARGDKPRRLTGSPARVRAEIEEVAAAYEADEAIVVTITHDHQARRRSYELLAEEFGLPRRTADQDFAVSSARCRSATLWGRAGSRRSGPWGRGRRWWGGR